MHRVFDKIFRGKDGKVVLWQFPNWALWGWIICSILGRLVRHGSFHTVLHVLAQVLLVAWAILEIKSGDSLFRRILGGIILLGIIWSLFARM